MQQLLFEDYNGLVFLQSQSSMQKFCVLIKSIDKFLHRDEIV